MMRTQLKQPEKDPFLCQCAPCKSYWKKNFKGMTDLLVKPPIDRAANSAVMFEAVRKRENHPAVLKIGDRVTVRGEFNGKVQFVGILDENEINPPCYVGVHLDENIGSVHNGMLNGKRYFHCPRGHGMMVKYGEVVRINPPETRPPVKGNEMFPSYKTVCANRKAMQEQIEAEKLRAQNERIASRSKSRSKGRPPPKTVVFDSQDIAFKDTQKQTIQEKKKSYQRQWRPSCQPMENKAIDEHVNKWKNTFGEGQQADLMAKTLRKLHMGYKKGYDSMV